MTSTAHDKHVRYALSQDRSRSGFVGIGSEESTVSAK